MDHKSITCARKRRQLNLVEVQEIFLSGEMHLKTTLIPTPRSYYNCRHNTYLALNDTKIKDSHYWKPIFVIYISSSDKLFLILIYAHCYNSKHNCYVSKIYLRDNN